MYLRDERGQILGSLLLGLLLTMGISAGITAAANSYYGGSADGDVGTPLGGALRDRVYQGKTIADMRAISQATVNFRLRTGRYPAALDELASTGALSDFSPTDMWGSAWVYHTDRGHFVLLSYGADGASGPAAPDPWEGNVYGPDLIIKDGEWIQTPRIGGSLVDNLQHRQAGAESAPGR